MTELTPSRLIVRDFFRGADREKADGLCFRIGASAFTKRRQHAHGNMEEFSAAPGDRALGPCDTGRLRIFSGSSNPALAKDIAMSLGMDLSGITIKRFADGEVYVQLQVRPYSLSLASRSLSLSLSPSPSLTVHAAMALVGERAWVRRVPSTAHHASGERPLDGAAGDDRRVPSRVRPLHHRRGALLRVYKPTHPTTVSLP
jgi:hypothetical protein